MNRRVVFDFNSSDPIDREIVYFSTISNSFDGYTEIIVKNHVIGQTRSIRVPKLSSLKEIGVKN
ncbi:MAG: hypothetical protein ACFFDN_44565 [Candidatus Hodarchaeota archaeon]